MKIADPKFEELSDDFISFLYEHPKTPATHDDLLRVVKLLNILRDRLRDLEKRCDNFLF